MRKLIIHHQVNYNNYRIRYFNVFFNDLVTRISYNNEVILNGYSKNSHKGRSPIVLDSDDSETPKIINLGDCEMIVEDYETKKAIVFSVADMVSRDIIDLQSNPNVTDIYISQFNRALINNLVDEKYRYKYKPWVYFKANDYNLDDFYLERKKLNFFFDKLYFRGDLRNRNLIKKFNTDYFYGGESINGPFERYVDEMIKFSVGLSVSGIGEFCYRDVEYMAIGIPFLRFEYLSEMREPLIPNYHYISIERPDDLKNINDNWGSENHTKIIIKRFLEVKDDKDFLNFISNNARKYYENYLSPESLIKNTLNLLNF
jgi:hypothetical protein